MIHRCFYADTVSRLESVRVSSNKTQSTFIRTQWLLLPHFLDWTDLWHRSIARITRHFTLSLVLSELRSRIFSIIYSPRTKFPLFLWTFRCRICPNRLTVSTTTRTHTHPTDCNSTLFICLRAIGIVWIWVISQTFAYRKMICDGHSFRSLAFSGRSLLPVKFVGNTNCVITQKITSMRDVVSKKFEWKMNFDCVIHESTPLSRFASNTRAPFLRKKKSKNP